MGKFADQERNMQRYEENRRRERELEDRGQLLVIAGCIAFIVLMVLI